MRPAGFTESISLRTEATMLIIPVKEKPPPNPANRSRLRIFELNDPAIRSQLSPVVLAGSLNRQHRQVFE